MALRIHHLNCGSMCPVGGCLMDGCSHGLTGLLVVPCLLIETPSSRLVLIDTGLGLGDVGQTYPRLSALYVKLLNTAQGDNRRATGGAARLFAA